MAGGHREAARSVLDGVEHGAKLDPRPGRTNGCFHHTKQRGGKKLEPPQLSACHDLTYREFSQRTVPMVEITSLIDLSRSFDILNLGAA
jgi:hypothetical protein